MFTQFLPCLVTSVHTRPTTPKQDHHQLYYSQSDIRRFKECERHTRSEESSPTNLTTPVQVWEPSPPFVSAIINALLKKRQQPESLHIIPPEPRSEWPPLHNSSPPSPAKLQWPSTPYSKPNSTKYEAYRKSADDFKVGHLTPHAITSGLDRIKVPYGTVKRRPKIWGPNQATKSMFPAVFDHAR